MSRDNLLTYLYLNEEFEIHSDASYFQLGAVISQIFKPVALYIRTLTDAYRRYTVTEREMLGIVETLN